MGCRQSRDAQYEPTPTAAKKPAPVDPAPPWFTAYHRGKECLETPWECPHKPTDDGKGESITLWLTAHSLTKQGCAIPLSFKDSKLSCRYWIKMAYAAGERFHHSVYIDAELGGDTARYYQQSCQLECREGIYCLSGRVKYMGENDFVKTKFGALDFTLTLYKNHLDEESGYFCHGTMWVPGIYVVPDIVAIAKS